MKSFIVGLVILLLLPFALVLLTPFLLFMYISIIGDCFLSEGEPDGSSFTPPQSQSVHLK